MSNVQYAVVLGNTSPFIRVLKFVGTVCEVMALPFASPAAINGAAFSPDGKALVAVLAASGTNVIKLWTRTSAYSDDWTERTVTTPIPGAARVVWDVDFAKENELVIGGTDILWYVTLDRDTAAFTFEQVHTTSSYGGRRRVHVTQDGRTIFSTHVMGSSNATGLFLNYKSGASWTGIGTAVGPYNNGVKEFEKNKYLFSTNATPVLRGAWLADGVFPPTVLTNFTTILTADAVADASVTTSTPLGRPAVTPDGKVVFSPISTSPYIVRRGLLNVSPTREYWVEQEAYAGPTFPARILDTETISDGVLLFAINSATTGTGRVRGLRYNGEHEALTEIPEISALFNDWNVTPFYLDISEPFPFEEAPTSLYNSFVLDLLNDDVDLTSIKILVVNSSAVFNKAHTTLTAAVGANEVYGSSWPEGGIAVNSLTLTPVGSNGEVSLNLSVPSLALNDPGMLTFRSAILYDDADANKRPIAFVNFSTDQTATQYDSMNFSAADGRLALFEPET